MRPKSSSTPNQTARISRLNVNECLAKTRADSQGNVGAGCSVKVHSQAAYETARQLLNYYCNFRTNSLWDPKKDLLAPLLHDVGKISPLFQEKIHRAFQPDFPDLVSKGVKLDENHCVTSALTLNRLRLSNLAWVAASHHGSFCSSADVPADAEFLGGTEWENLRETFVQNLAKEFGLELADISQKDWKKELVLGLTILADWLSSGMELEPGEEPTSEKCAETVKNAGFVPFKICENLKFSELFQSKYQSGFEPNYVQKTMLENVQPGGVYVLEMEMGAGKTEAALALAYELLARFGHTGIYFALPTQLTSNKIYERFVPFLENILDPKNKDREALLLHGKAWLEKNLKSDGEDGFQKNVRKVDSWFSDRKRGLLAPFAVGTIDQLLMAVIHVRHSALRALGVAGKVVILDEVHSYDAYTGSLICYLVKRLREWNCTVIILSATLSQKLRNELLEVETDSEKPESVPYPLLSVRGESSVFYPEIDRSEVKSKKVRITHIDSIEKAYDLALDHAERGEYVLWIENTVADAQEVFRYFVSHPIDGVEVGLIHSRFQEITRRKNEDEWVRKYGKNATKAKRAGGKILVGTQVLEQSVDIDSDFLVTRLCPTDMLLQRVGRLWRHESLNEFRPISAQCEVVILNEEEDHFHNKEEWSDFEKTPPVYAPYVLMRSQEVLKKRDQIVIPRDMRELIESTYSERKEENWYAHLKNILESERAKLERFADLSKSGALQTRADTEASTRYSEVETVEVLLVQYFDENQITPFGASKSITIPPKNAPREIRTKCAIELSEYLVRVRIDVAPSYADFPLESLSHVLYTGYGDDRPLRAAYVGANDVLLDQSGNPAKVDSKTYETESKIKSMSYHSKTGYSYERKETK